MGTGVALYEQRQIGDIIKSNRLVEAKYDLTLIEQKLVLLAISKIDTGNIKRNIVNVGIREFCTLIGSSQERYTEIREILRNLRKKEILITRYDNKKDIQEELIAGWIDTAYYKNGTVDIEFPDALMPYLVELKERYTIYNFKYIRNLQSKHSIRIYELMKENEFKHSYSVDCDKLKDLICGNDKFDRYYDFKKRVLLTSQEEIARKTDISVDFEEIRSGKKVVTLKFTIRKNKLVDEQTKEEKLSSAKEYYGESDVFSIVEKYRKKSRKELSIELFNLLYERYKISMELELLETYREESLMNVIFGIIDGLYADVKKPIPYFKKVLEKEEKNFSEQNK